MPRFSANLTMLFQEVPFMERFKAAAQAGFRAVEFMFPYEYELETLQAELTSNQLQLVLFNLPAGNWQAGERGIAVDPRRQEEFKAGVAKAVNYAKALGVQRINCLVGKSLPEVPQGIQYQTMVENLRYAAEQLAAVDCMLLVEAVNWRDIPGFFLNTSSQVLRLLEDVGQGNVYLQYDVYHAQRMEGELIATICSALPKIGHIQIADNPGRHEPGTGEINYPAVLSAIDQCGYKGYVGLEYIPSRDTKNSLGWIGEYGYSL